MIELPFAIICGVLLTASVYLMLSRSFVRIILGLAIISNAVNLLIFLMGRLVREVPPIIPAHDAVLGAGAANPLPQALILTAIVISFAFFAFALILAYRARQELSTIDTNAMRAAEPIGETPLMLETLSREREGAAP